MRQQTPIRAMYEQCLRQGPRSLEAVLPVPYSTSHASMGLSGLYPTQVRGRPKSVGTSVVSDSVQVAGDRTPRAMSEPPKLANSEAARPPREQPLSLQRGAPPWSSTPLCLCLDEYAPMWQDCSVLNISKLCINR